MASTFDDTRTAAVNGTTLAYRERGQGEPVVFVHGDLSDLRTWDAQLPAVGGSHRAISYSRRYARPGDDIPEGVDNQMMPHVDDLAEFLRAIDAAPAHLVGNSWGAFICLLTAIHHPQVVRSLVLCEPPVLTFFVGMPPRPAELLRLFARRPRTALATVKFGATALGPAQKAFSRGDDETAMVTFTRGVLGKERFDALPEARRQQASENVRALKASLLGAGFPPLSAGELEGVTADTLLMNGEHSPAFFVRLTDPLEELLPNAERIQIRGASHMMHEQEPAAVNEAILDFLARRPSAGGGAG